MSTTQCEIRRGAYYDSIVLMYLQRALAELPGVIDAGVAMATPTNKDLLARSDLLPELAAGARPEDLLIVVRAGNESAVAEALEKVDDLLNLKRVSIDAEFRPRGLESAVRMLPEAGWTLISVPGRYAARVARQALDLDLHVFLYSDNVSLEDELALKEAARSKGLLVMGPDCGTAIVNGIGLGFANRVRRGAVGIVGASGTGIQAIASRVHALGGGISHALGTGGRDLKARVGGITARGSLDLLSRDAGTQVIVLVSKPPDEGVASGLLAEARRIRKPVVVYFIGSAAPAGRLGNLHFASSLDEAAKLAVELAEAGNEPATGNPAPGANGYLRGLFSGGTLAYEALLALRHVASPLYSNLGEGAPLADLARSQGHTIIDLGADEFTVGKLHPMIDYDLRLRRMKQEAADPEMGTLLIDVVLGEGAHPDPAAELAPVIREITNDREIEVLTILIGTDEDPQNASEQARSLEAAGVRVFRGVSEAVDAACRRILPDVQKVSPEVPLAALESPLAAINVGLESFYASLIDQGARAVQVDWRPPAGGDERLMSILSRLKG